jgi:hypothetical protein
MSSGESIIKPRPGDPTRPFILPMRISQHIGSPHLESMPREEKLFQAVYTGDLEQVKLLLYQKIDHGVRHPGLGMSTPLHLAVIARQTKCVEYLIDRGACPYVLNALGKSPMDYAAENKEMLRTVMLALQIREQAIRRLRERNVIAKDKELKEKEKEKKEEEQGNVKGDAEKVEDCDEEKVGESSAHDSPMIVEEEAAN